MRRRVSLVILKAKKLLLVKGSKGFYADFYFTPGGRVEGTETDINALVRECNEELNITPTNPHLYLTYEAAIQGTDEKQVVNCYIVQIDTSKIKVSNEVTKKYWYSRANYLKNSPRIADSIYTNLIPALIRDKLI